MLYATAINVLPDDGPVRAETRSSLMFLKKIYCLELNDNCANFLAEIVESQTSLYWQDAEYFSVKVKVGGKRIFTTVVGGARGKKKRRGSRKEKE